MPTRSASWSSHWPRHAPSAQLLRNITEATSGNPLLVRSLVRRALERDQLVVREGELVSATGTALLADGHDLDRAVRDRLAKVDDRCRQLLTLAAFLGDDRPVAELLLATDDPVDADALVDEAVAADLLEEHGDHYRFAHPQIRHVLYHAPQGRQRWRLHLQAADLLDQAGGAGSALRAARHLAQAGPLADPARVCERSRAAAEHALSVGAWSDASRAAEAAIASLPEGARWEDLCDLHTTAAWAAFHDFDASGLRSHADRAITLARANGDGHRWGEAVVPFLRACLTNAHSEVHLDRALGEARALLREGTDGSGDEVRAMVAGLVAEGLALDQRDLPAARAQIEAAQSMISDHTSPAVASHVAAIGGLVALADFDLPLCTRPLRAGLAAGRPAPRRPLGGRVAVQPAGAAAHPQR